MTYAHDAHCNTIHKPGPEPCPPARDVPALDLAGLAGIESATIVRPGDTLVISFPEMTQAEFHHVSESLRQRLDKSIQLVTLAGKVELTVLRGGE